MEEDGAAFAGRYGRVVVTQDNDDIVEMIFAPEVFGAGGSGVANVAVVVRVCWIVAPTVVGIERVNGEGERREGEAVGPIIDFAQRPAACGGCAIAFLFGGGGDDTVAA